MLTSASRNWIPVRWYSVNSNHINHTLMHTQPHTHSLTHRRTPGHWLPVRCYLVSVVRNISRKKNEMLCVFLSRPLFHCFVFARGARSLSRSPLLPSFIPCTSFSSRAIRIPERLVYTALSCTQASLMLYSCSTHD